MYASSRRQWETGKAGMLRSLGSLRVRHDLATEEWQIQKMVVSLHKKIFFWNKLFCPPEITLWEASTECQQRSRLNARLSLSPHTRWWEQMFSTHFTEKKVDALKNLKLVWGSRGDIRSHTMFLFFPNSVFTTTRIQSLFRIITFYSAGGKGWNNKSTMCRSSFKFPGASYLGFKFKISCSTNIKH